MTLKFLKAVKSILSYYLLNLAKEHGQSAMWVQDNVKINLWENESPNKGATVGHMFVSSHAVIIKEGKDDYYVKSQLDGSIGWVSKIQTKGTMLKDTKTFKPCSK